MLTNKIARFGSGAAKARIPFLRTFDNRTAEAQTDRTSDCSHNYYGHMDILPQKTLTQNHCIRVVLEIHLA